MEPGKRFDHASCAPMWSGVWERVKLNTSDMSRAKRPYYNLMMFPYPSAEGLHVGNMYAFTGADIYGRFMRMQGYDVFEPIGLDGFGIHSENYALKVGRHPMDHAERTQGRFYEQLRTIGAMFDWERTLETYDPGYYRWTQWLFTQMFKKGLAYRAEAKVNWCPGCKTVLADEQVIDDACERCGNKVEKRSLIQWFFRITAYAERLLDAIPSLDWTQKVKIAQTNWIGKKEGIDIAYEVRAASGKPVGTVRCFTTRPDTQYGATFIVLAPEHEFVNQILRVITKKKSDEIRQYVDLALKRSEQERIAEGTKKTGVDTGLVAIHPLTGHGMPVYISDFVIMGVGTGAVVGVPGHDRRDYEFAQAFGLPVKRVVQGPDGEDGPITSEAMVHEGDGIIMDSGALIDGKTTDEAIRVISDHIEKNGWGKRRTTYHLRDWLISRQRYWGPPIPMIHCGACEKAGKSWFTGREKDAYQLTGLSAKEEKAHMDAMCGWYPVPDDQLPVMLPRIEEYRPGDDGIAPLAKEKGFADVICPGCGAKAVRETDVSDTFLDSSWYFLRYPSVGAQGESKEAFDQDITKTWLPVHMYTGGAEHSVLHLLYSRFVTKVLHDLGAIGFEEPFSSFFAHGLVIKDGAKMSKSKGNVVNPDEYIKLYGADALRLYLMFMGPFSDGGDFQDNAMEGMSRWVGRIWRMAHRTLEAGAPPTSSRRVKERLHTAIRKATEDIPKRRYNTAIASMMEFTNAAAEAGETLGRDDLGLFVKILAPFAPFLAEEIWSKLQGVAPDVYTRADSVHVQPWPQYDPALLVSDTVTVVAQVNGKVRGSLILAAAQASDKDAVTDAAGKDPGVSKHLAGMTVAKVVFIPGRIINFVVKPS